VLHGSAQVARALGGHQETELGFGALGNVALEYVILPALGLALEGGSVWLADGEAPTDPSIADQSGASALYGSAGVRVRPFASSEPRVLSPAGLWAGAGGGVTQTGGLTRPVVSAHLGWDFLLRGGTVGVGPALGYLHVFQSNAELRPADANVLSAGLHGSFDLRPPRYVDDDRDDDGIRNKEDACPLVPEDKDGFEDKDGCPELDNDQDGIQDLMDQCPLVPEDKDGFEDKDGCPDKDNDKDGILDKVDACPLDPEDKDGFEDKDGCPDKDNDQDGFPDLEDLCPNEPETKNGYADTDGCPDEDQVRVVGDKIVLDDRVHFRTNNAAIRPESHRLLERLAKLLRDHPEYIHIHIQGHADPRGDARFNQQLSEGRAASVLEFLVSQGVERQRLSSEGLGESHVRAEGSDERSWFLNRRVEFTVTRARPEDAPAAPVGGTGTTDNPTPELPGAVPAPASSAPAGAGDPPAASAGETAPARAGSKAQGGEGSAPSEVEEKP
jgi:outer membrane protein OmpA-like peptidoglycan-associated protein